MRKLLTVIPIMHLLLFASIGLNLSIFRQCIVFIYLSFIPGFLLLKILRLKETSTVNIILFSVGLSVAFSMFTGLLINELYLALGISRPLTTTPLAITLGILTSILFLVGYRNDLSESSSIGENFVDQKAIIGKSVILFLPVLLSIIGGIYFSQPILLLMIMVVAVLFALSVLFTRLISRELYPLAIFSISIALAFQLLLTSKYIIGYDAQLEYSLFRLTSLNGYWHPLPMGINPTTTVTYDSMLSITVLPAIYSALMNINGEIVFKVLYSFVFSLVPLTLYQIYKRQMGNSSSLLSTFFFLSSPLVFYGLTPLSLNRQVVAELFLTLSILAFLDDTMPLGKRRLLLIVFGAALVVSHYSVMLIYLFLIFSTYAVSKFRGQSNEVLNGTVVAMLFIMAFSWYSVLIGPLVSLSQFFQQVISRFFIDIYSPRARFDFSIHPVSTFASRINWALFYLVHFVIAIGILALLFKPAKTKLDPKYRIVAILSAVILFLCIVVPNVAPALHFERFYAITILFLAPCFVLGGETLGGIVEKVVRSVTSRSSLSNAYNRISTVLLCVVLIGYFLSQSGFINCVTGAAPLSTSLDFNRMRASSDPSLEISFHDAYILEQDVFSAIWLSRNMRASSTIYADYVSRAHVLTSYGLIPRQQIRSLTNETTLEQGDLIYLGELNVVNGIMTSETAAFNTSEISPILEEKNLIYSNGNSEIWFTSSPS